jgi:hypothetical protein
MASFPALPLDPPLPAHLAMAVARAGVNPTADRHAINDGPARPSASVAFDSSCLREGSRACDGLRRPESPLTLSLATVTARPARTEPSLTLETGLGSPTIGPRAASRH